MLIFPSYLEHWVNNSKNTTILVIQKQNEKMKMSIRKIITSV